MKRIKPAGLLTQIAQTCAATIFLSLTGPNSPGQEPSQKPVPPPAASASTTPTQKTEASSQNPPPANPPAPADPRQAQILADTRKLLKLSLELQAEVARSSKDTLSLTVIRKAEEVERLARTLREEIGRNH